MAEGLEEYEFQISGKDLKDFKRDLLATVYNQTHTQLLIYQQSKRLKTAQIIKSRKSSKNVAIADIEEPMPPAELLNDIKLDKELDTLRNIYKVAYEELCQNYPKDENSHSELKKVIELQKQNNNEVVVLSKELEKNKIILKHLREEQKIKQNEMMQQLNNKSERVANLRDQLNNTKRINHLEMRLVEKWEKNRLTQATIVGEMEERKLIQEILELHRRLADEQRLIYEIEAFRNDEISGLKEQISQWEQKFQEGKSKIMSENMTLSQNIADVVKSYEKHREIMEERKIFVTEYLQQKAEEKRFNEQQRYRIQCTIRIQAWWRGVMVRRCLGLYRKKSKKDKKSKSKK